MNKCLRICLDKSYKGLCTRNIRKYCKLYGNGPVQLAYASFQHQTSSLEDPPLVIIHGLFGNKRNWQAIAKAIAHKGKKVITVDCRNHGNSPHTEHMDYHVMSQDLERLFDDLDIPSADIIGHSMGGKVAMTLALTKPELVNKLVVEDVSPRMSPIREQYPAYMSAMQEVVLDNTVPLSTMRRYIKEHLENIIPDEVTREFIVTNIGETGDVYHWTCNLDTIDKCFDNIAGFPQFSGAYQGDTLFIAGGKSEHIRQIDLPLIRQLFPESRVEYIHDAGHWVHAEKPTQFIKIVLDFLKTNKKS